MLHANWVKESVSSGGTGNLTLGGAETAHITFNTALGTDRDFIYVIEDGNDREVGVGHLSASTTLVRDQVMETLVTGTLDRTSHTAINASTASLVSIASASQGILGGFRPDAFFGDTFSGITSVGQVDQGGTSYSCTTGFLYMFPFWLPISQLIDTVGVSCVTSTASGGVMVGLYEVNSGGQAGNLVIDFTNSAELDCSTTGKKEATASAAVYVSSGFYLLAMTTNSSTIKMAGPHYSASGIYMGMDSTTGLIATEQWRSFSYGSLISDESANTFTTASTGRNVTAWVK